MLMGMLYHTIEVRAHYSVSTVLVYYISAWASALLVLLSWAMRRPLCVERVTVQIPALFLFIAINKPVAESEESIGAYLCYDKTYIMAYSYVFPHVVIMRRK